MDAHVARAVQLLAVRDSARVRARAAPRLRAAWCVHRDPDRVLGVRARGARDVPARWLEDEGRVAAMRLTTFPTAEEFVATVRPTLAEHEAEHHLLLGVAEAGLGRPNDGLVAL